MYDANIFKTMNTNNQNGKTDNKIKIHHGLGVRLFIMESSK
jgi:hypothetical protein